MDLLEYQGKQLFAKHGIAVPGGEVAATVDEAVAAAERTGEDGAISAGDVSELHAASALRAKVNRTVGVVYGRIEVLRERVSRQWFRGDTGPLPAR